MSASQINGSDFHRIEPIPASQVALVTASYSITSLQTVIAGLIAYSLQNRSTNIRIHLDRSTGAITLQDNGDGVSPTEVCQIMIYSYR